MRQLFNPQLELGATPIEEIKFNSRSRDDIPQILRGLQFIYGCPATRDAVFDVLQHHIGVEIDFENGRPGMDLWVLLVLGTLRLGLNCDYDRLHDLANEHKTIRAMLGHGGWQDEYLYGLQTLRDNVALLTEEMLKEINVLVVKAGHGLVKKKDDDDVLLARCDSFVVETHVEYPTDTGMLWDATRKSILLTTQLCLLHTITGWRQSAYNLKRLKAHWRKAQKSNRSRQANAEEKKKKAHKRYLQLARQYFEKVQSSIGHLEETSQHLSPQAWSHLQEELEKVGGFQDYAELLMGQIERRVLKDEVISAKEKIYSIFQPHTEWISKGKAGVLVELGLKVCIMEDQYQFILHHQVMEKTQDVDVAISMVIQTQENFPSLNSCSFDKGFHSPANQTGLTQHLDQVVLPKKGHISSKEKVKTNAPAYRKVRRQHSAVESAINALEQHGLDRCPDHGIDGFKRYVALGVLARNLQRIGAILTQKEREKLKRKWPREPCRQAA
ncbi:MAG: ISNCY family transposase [Pseudomonadales bacterium]|nr:ISNCY family transposase [Pseudomonadales bacterium]MBL4865532.1 ISNCY family transposase [Pseudomonadales bacterium]MBL4865894.1 ISNCY family transposase [Pseudomonadales bacterium]MBL4868126.1 ISNCY family transposase [Pseudomonadales bacterium]MBL4868389.1 ISNCY family transposase [Pseudomonadales bacterium]